MKYIAPVAELVSMETVSVIMASTTCVFDNNGTPDEEI